MVNKSNKNKKIKNTTSEQLKFDLTGAEDVPDELDPTKDFEEVSRGPELQPFVEQANELASSLEDKNEEETKKPVMKRRLMYDDGSGDAGVVEEEFSLTRDRPVNKRRRGRTENQKRRAFVAYQELKKKVVEIENKNRNRLILYPASDYDTNPKKFYVMGGASAIILSYELADRIGQKFVLRPDSDTIDDKNRFRYGVRYFTNIEKLTDQLDKINIQRIEVEEDDRLIGFRLLRNYEPSDLAAMLENRKKQIENANAIYYAKVLYPDLHKKIIQLERLVPPRIKHMNEPYKSLIGAKMIDSLWSVIRNYSRITHGDGDVLVTGAKMQQDFDDMLAMLSWMQELEILDMSTCVRIGILVAEARVILCAKIKDATKKE